jgi:predicted transcriptional regulator
MIRVQLLLSEEQNEKITHLAKRLKTSKSKLFREAVEIILREKISESADPLLELVGQAGEAGRSDISTYHDEFLSQKEKNGWQGTKSS